MIDPASRARHSPTEKVGPAFNETADELPADLELQPATRYRAGVGRKVGTLGLHLLWRLRQRRDGPQHGRREHHHERKPVQSPGQGFDK